MPKKYHWMRRPHTTAEMRANQNEWSRPRRRHLPNTYDDISIHEQKSWKENRRYKHRGRGKKHSIVLEDYNDKHTLEWYLKDHNIPYRIDEIRRTKIKIFREYYYYFYRGIQPSQRYPKLILPVYEKVELNPPIIRRRKISEVVGYYVVWWYNKDIGLKYILPEKE